MNHTCHARGCRVRVHPRFLMCRRHWDMVAPTLRARVWAAYRSGQERLKNPSLAYLEAAQAAIDAVALREASHVH